MTDTIQDRIRQHLCGENDEDPSRLLREACDRIEFLEDLVRQGTPTYRAPPEAWESIGSGAATVDYNDARENP